MWVDVAESSMSWPNIMSLWKDTKDAIANAITDLGSPAWVGAHISHTYKNGVCVYFHFASILLEDDSDLDIYLAAKKAATAAILKNGGALSHHHGVGFEHVPFMSKQFDETSLKLLRSMKRTLDPKNICNPGKLLPPEGKEDVDDQDHLFWTRGITEEKKSKL